MNGIYFRAQSKGYSFEEMQNHVSVDGGDEREDFGGICACVDPSDLLNNTVMDAMDDDDEVVIFRGNKLCDIYDGVRVDPIEEIDRMTVKEFSETGGGKYSQW